jgi:uncharacterized protein involved in tolerance to divalent cations
MNSIYIWDGKLQEESEVVMIAKTTERGVADLIARVKSPAHLPVATVHCEPEGGRRLSSDSCNG